jgi:hypothetical protein
MKAPSKIPHPKSGTFQDSPKALQWLRAWLLPERREQIVAHNEFLKAVEELQNDFGASAPGPLDEGTRHD